MADEHALCQRVQWINLASLATSAQIDTADVNNVLSAHTLDTLSNIVSGISSERASQVWLAESLDRIQSAIALIATSPAKKSLFARAKGQITAEQTASTLTQSIMQGVCSDTDIHKNFKASILTDMRTFRATQSGANAHVYNFQELVTACLEREDATDTVETKSEILKQVLKETYSLIDITPSSQTRFILPHEHASDIIAALERRIRWYSFNHPEDTLAAPGLDARSSTSSVTSSSVMDIVPSPLSTSILTASSPATSTPLSQCHSLYKPHEPTLSTSPGKSTSYHS